MKSQGFKNSDFYQINLTFWVFRSCENGLLNKWVKIEGTISFNQFDKENSIELNKIEEIEAHEEERQDNAPVKRVELHAHTKMSAMDGIADAEQLVLQAAKWGHNAIAITDHVAVQAFPAAQKGQIASKKLYGKEIMPMEDLMKMINTHYPIPWVSMMDEIQKKKN